MSAAIPAIVLGGTGYVAGELMRLLSTHPVFDLAAVASDSQPGEPVGNFFGHLQGALPELSFLRHQDILARLSELPSCAVFSAAPHGVSAGLIDALLLAGEKAGTALRVVDISADFRYSSAEAWHRVYGQKHGAPNRIASFTCAVPEHLQTAPTDHVAHPGCFATAMLLATVPLLALGAAEPRFFISGVTGSTGSGRQPAAGTHHPQRHGDLYAYKPLSHRHAPEVTELARAASGVEAEICFVPHSGPFARGIHVTVQAAAARSFEVDELLNQLNDFYRDAPFVQVLAAPPRIKDVAASNYARISAATEGNSVVVMCAIDNLVKGAAGGAIQWMNRLYGLDETLGLEACAPGWT